MRDYLKRIMIYLAGIVFLSLGIQLMINAKLGVAAVDVLVLGTARITGFSYGTILPIVTFILLGIYGLWNKKIPPISAFVTSYLVGQMVNLYNHFHLGIYQNDLFINIGVVILGTLTIAFGSSLIIQSKLGISSQDLLMLTIVNKFKWSVRLSKFSLEFTFFFIGFLLGGPVGIGTVLITVLIGPFLHFFRDHVNFIMEKA